MIWGHTCRSQPGRWSRGRCLWHDENSWKEVPVSTVFKHPFTIIPVSHTLGEARVSANVDKRRSSYSNEKIIYKWKVWTREYLKLETMIHRPNVNVLMGSWMLSRVLDVFTFCISGNNPTVLMNSFNLQGHFEEKCCFQGTEAQQTKRNGETTCFKWPRHHFGSWNNILPVVVVKLPVQS